MLFRCVALAADCRAVMMLQVLPARLVGLLLRAYAAKSSPSALEVSWGGSGPRLSGVSSGGRSA